MIWSQYDPETSRPGYFVSSFVWLSSTQRSQNTSSSAQLAREVLLLLPVLLKLLRGHPCQSDILSQLEGRLRHPNLDRLQLCVWTVEVRTDSWQPVTGQRFTLFRSLRANSIQVAQTLMGGNLRTCKMEMSTVEALPSNFSFKCSHCGWLKSKFKVHSWPSGDFDLTTMTI